MSGARAITVGALTDKGQVRELNQDSIGTPERMEIADELLAQRGELLAVADGMGGHAAGEVASQEAIDSLYTEYYGNPSSDLPRSLRRAVEKANARIHAQASSDEVMHGMGTTLVAAVIRGDRLIVANVGDSRAYIFREGVLRQISRDHSWVAETLAAGLITEEQAKTHSYRNLITRALGQRPEVEVDLFQERLRAGDVLLLCSDGLTNEVDDVRIAQVLSQGSPVEAVRSLVILANRGGGRDNVSAVVSQIPSGRERLRSLPVLTYALGILALVAVVALAFALRSLVLSNGAGEAGLDQGQASTTAAATEVPIPPAAPALENAPPWQGRWANMVPGNDTGQTFTTAAPSISVVEIEIMTKENYAGGNDEVTLRLQGEDGTELATESRTVPWGFNGWLRFELPHGGLEVLPGQTLVIEAEDTKAMFGWKYGANTYPGGVAMRLGVERPNYDFRFRVIP